MATIEQRIYDGNRAKEVLENESFKWAFESIQEELTETWKNSPARDAEGREKIYLAIQILKKLQACLVSSLETGKLAEMELNHKRTLLDRAKEIWQD